MKFKEAIKDTNEAVKTLNSLHYHKSFKYSLDMMKQGIGDIYNGLKQLLVSLLCLSIYPLMPIAYPIAVIIRMVKK